MGCDIHLYRERLVNGKWETADEWEQDKYEPGTLHVPWEKRFTVRNYELFSVLAGVRQREEPPYTFAPRGLPLGMSKEVSQEALEWNGDGHSHSYLYLFELVELLAFLGSRKQTISGMKDRDELAALRASLASEKPDYSLLYPYCQGTNDPRQVSFSVEIPADYIVGSHVADIIERLRSVGGENQRIVFWFDPA